MLRSEAQPNKLRIIVDRFSGSFAFSICACCAVTGEQFGGGEHAAGMHFVHVKDGTTADLLVVGVQFDVTEYGTNVEVGLRVRRRTLS